jgi:methylmalonyl-CoA/ethylmalonyl-CoA epimerase
VTRADDDPNGGPASFVEPGVALHHLGVACKNLEADSAQFELLGFAREGDDFEDPMQGIRGRFLVGAGVRLELLEDLEGSGVLEPWLAARTKIYHHAYETADLEVSLGRLLDAGARVTRAPVPAVVFGGRRVVFAMLPNLMLIELIERTGAEG